MKIDKIKNVDYSKDNFLHIEKNKKIQNFANGLNSCPIKHVSFASNVIKNEAKSNALETKFENIIENNQNIIKDVKQSFTKKLAQKIANKPNEPIVIFINGESASGKSTFCSLIEKYAKVKNLPISFVKADNYFNDISSLINKYGDFDSVRNSGYDIDSPENFQLDLLKEDLTKLKDGKDIKAPKYLINGTGISLPEAIDTKTNKIIVVEGIASGYVSGREFADVVIYVDTAENIREERFLKRAVERNQTEQDAVDHWNYVRQAGRKYVQPALNKSDIVLNGEAGLNEAMKLIEDVSEIF